jgi:hypothetical protein
MTIEQKGEHTAGVPLPSAFHKTTESATLSGQVIGYPDKNPGDLQFWRSVIRHFYFPGPDRLITHRNPRAGKTDLPADRIMIVGIKG